MSIDLKGRRCCDCCGRLIAKAHRIEGRNEYCGTCYKREFVSRPCTCGKIARVLRNADAPYRCRACVAATRICIRCDRAVPRAGLRVGNGVVCPSCRPHFAPKSHCESCGALSSTLARRAGDMDAPRQCARCSTSETHATCVHCRRHRRVAGFVDEGRPYCASCGAAGVRCHACPDCGGHVSGVGFSRCRGCVNKAALASEVELQVLTLNRSDCREWICGFATWLHERAPDDPGLMGDFTRHLPFFERLDTLLDERPTCTVEWLLATIPVREMRQHLQVMRYLETNAGLVLSPEAKRDAAARDRIADLLRRSRTAPFAPVIQAYADALAARGCRLSTQRQYLSTAIAFCEAAGVVNAGWTDEVLTTYLVRHPGQRLNLGVFVRFCQHDQGWQVAGLPLKSPISESPGRTATRFRSALVKVRAQGPEARPVDVARLLARAFALPLAVLRTAKLHHTAQEIFLVTREGRHRIPQTLHALALQWEAKTIEG